MSHDLEGVQTLVSQTLILPSDREREAELYVALCAEHCHQLHALNPRQQHANATFKLWKEKRPPCVNQGHILALCSRHETAEVESWRYLADRAATRFHKACHISSCMSCKESTSREW